MATVNWHFDSDFFTFRAATAFPQLVRNDGTNYPVSGLAFDAASEEAAFVRFRARNYGSGNLTALINWYADSATSGDIIWGISLAAITPNTDSQDMETKAFATEQTATDSHLGTVAQRSHDISLTISNLDSLAADDHVELKVVRKAAAAGDTMTGDGILTMLDISYSDT
jgi:hypothetical protein